MIDAVLDWIRLEAADITGRPTRIRRLLSAIDAPTLADVRSPPHIDGARIPQWQSFIDGQTVLNGGGPRRSDYHNPYQICVPELATLIIRTVSERAVDIRDVAVMAASRTDLTQYESLSALAQVERPVMLAEATSDTIEALLAEDEVRITRGPKRSQDFMQRASWDGRIELCNQGGSRRFAAAHCIAQTLGITRTIRTRFVELSVNHDALARLMARFAMYVFPEGCVHLDWHSAMEAFGAPWYWRDAPPPLFGYTLVLLPLDDSRSRVVADAVDDAGFPRLFDALAQPMPFDTPLQAQGAVLAH